MPPSSPGQVGVNVGSGTNAGYSLRAYAKINLSLEVTGKRPDGFHDLISVTQLISVADTLTVTHADAWTFEVEPPLLDDGENIAARAARALADRSGRPASAHLAIRKQIPVAAGLGGGSSDAAATLRLLDRLWASGTGRTDLADIAAPLGSDVPLFWSPSGTCLISGRGDRVTVLPSAPTFWLVLVSPQLAPTDKTRSLYAALRPDDFGTGATTAAVADALRSETSFLGRPLVNTFDAAAARVYPEFAALRDRLGEALERPVHLTGAGPSLFALYDQPTAARQAARRAARFGHRTLVARSIARRPQIRTLPVPASASMASPAR